MKSPCSYCNQILMYNTDVYIRKGYPIIRTQIYITEEEKKGIESIAISQGVSQSEFIRLAIDELLAKTISIDKSAILDEIAGIWSDRKEIPDIRDLRTGWRHRTMR